jgi:hypothetical protein
LKISSKIFSSAFKKKNNFQLVKFVATKKGMTTNFFSSLPFVAVFGSGIRDKHPGSATLIEAVFRILIRRIRQFWGFPDPHRQSEVRTRIQVRIHPSSSKNSKKNIYFYCFATSLQNQEEKNCWHCPSSAGTSTYVSEGSKRCSGVHEGARLYGGVPEGAR